MPHSRTYIAWLMLAAAVAAWIGVGFFMQAINTAQNDLISKIAQTQSSSNQVAQSLQIHAAVSNSAAARAELTKLVTVDPSALAQAIDSAGATAGSPIQISDASPASGVSLPSGIGTQAFAFTAAAQGSFASVMRAAQILETLPLPSSVQSLELIAAPTGGATAPSWQMNAQLRVLTASTISS